jgi:hypothetical protein
MLITIKNNRAYCKENKLASVRAVPCGCVGYSGGLRQAGGDDNCKKCCGLGFQEKDYYPFELVTGKNEFKMLWEKLDLPAAEKGEMYPSKFLSALKKLGKNSEHRKYLAGLCTEASRREEKIVWE